MKTRIICLQTGDSNDIAKLKTFSKVLDANDKLSNSSAQNRLHQFFMLKLLINGDCSDVISDKIAFSSFIKYIVSVGKLDRSKLNDIYE